MNASQRFAAAADLFLELREIPADQLDALLDRKCGADIALRAEVRRLLDARDDPSVFHTLAGQLLSANRNLRQQLVDTKHASSGARPLAGDSAPEEAPNDQIGAFRLLERIGEGGFGRVWVAEQAAPVRRRVALKLLKAGMDSREVLARFEKERQALAVMDHPNVAKVFDAGVSPRGRPYFVMEHVPGSSITSFCNAGRLRIRNRLELFTPVCDAVHHAHQKGIIHRDLKPSNILVTLIDGRPLPKVIDFGIAKATDASLGDHTAYTEVGRLMGTPEYMSPEQAAGGRDVDTRSDVYSLGVVLYQLLTGTLPFDGQMLRDAGSEGIARVIRELEPPKPSTRFSTLIAEPVTHRGVQTPAEIASCHDANVRSLQRELRGDLDWIVMKCLEKERARRYESAGDLARDIRRYLDGEPVVAAPPSFRYRWTKFAGRHRIALGAAGAALLTLIIGFGTSTAFYFQERATRQRAVEAEVAQNTLRQQADDARQAESAQRAAAERQRDIARTEAAKSARTVAFLQEMLAANDPDHAQGREVTVRETLDEAAARIERGDLRDEPEVQAAIRSTIGMAYVHLARLDDAARHLVPALDMRRELFGPEHPLVATSMIELGALRHVQGDYAAAEDLFRRALTMRIKLLGERDREVTTTRQVLAEICALQGQFDEAEALFAAVQSDRRAQNRPDDMEFVAALNAWGGVRQARGDFDGAEKLWRQALEIGLALGDEERAAIATAYNNLASIRYARGDFPAAIEQYRHVLAIRGKLLGPAHPDTASAQRNLATALSATGNLPEAESLYRAALEMQRQALPAAHPSIATTLEGLAVLLRMQGKPDESALLQREVLAIRAQGFPAEHPLVAQAQYFMGLVLLDQQKYDEAEAMLRGALELRRKTSADLVLAENLLNLGRARRLQGDLNEADQRLHEALALIERIGGPDHPRTAMMLNEQGLLLERRQDPDAAEKSYRAALAILQKSKLDARPDAATILHNLGRLLRQRGHRSEAESMLREALRIRTATLAPDHPLIDSTRADLEAVAGESAR